jgi:hypothetical protein
MDPERRPAWSPFFNAECTVAAHSLPTLKLTMASAPASFICAVCGQSHAGAPTDTAYTLPDAVWALPTGEREDKAKWTTDLCNMGGDYFIRCLLEIPFLNQPGYYGWGAWAKVEEQDFRKYLEFYDKDGSHEPPIPGALANELPTYDTTIGVPVLLRFRTSDQRPGIEFAAGADHLLAREAKSGMSSARFHEVLSARGVKGDL